MDYTQFKNLLNLKDVRNKDSVKMLEELIEKYPYFQTARVLLAKSLHEQQSIHYDEALKIAAAYSPDRRVLQELISPAPPPPEGGIKAPPIPAIVEELSSSHTPKRFERMVIPPSGGGGVEYPEWYSEEEISGKAFEEQDQKEKIVDPHKIIQQRLSEILAAPAKAKEEPMPVTPVAAPPEKREEEQLKTKEESPEIVNEKKSEVTSEHPSPIIYEEPSTSQDFGKTEPEQVESSTINENRNEEIILEEAGKAHDILDRMEIEHALEESILASLEKLPIIVEEKTLPPIPSLKSEQIKLVPEIVQHKEEAEKPDTSKSKSFTEWMSAISAKPFNRFEEVHLSTKASNVLGEEEVTDHDSGIPLEEEEAIYSYDEEISHDELIDKFIATEPKIVASKAEFYSPVNQAKKSLIEHEDLVTETLARIYTSQGHYAKARWCYEKLSLLYPEKSSYFAALLKEVEQKEKEVK